MWYYDVINLNYALSHILFVLCEIMQKNKSSFLHWGSSDFTDKVRDSTVPCVISYIVIFANRSMTTFFLKTPDYVILFDKKI